MRYLSGWCHPGLAHPVAQALRTCRQGGWAESCECNVEFPSDDGTTNNIPALETWNKLLNEGAKKFCRGFTLVKDDSRWKGMEAAGFVNMQLKNFKVCG